MPIASPIGFLDVVNATLRASQVESTSRLTVANTAATKNFSVGDKFHIDKDSVDPVSVTGNVVASGIKISNLTISPTFDLGSVSNVGNTTANTLQFANATTGFTTTANVEIGGNITLTSNAQVKVGSNMLAEYTGPHPRKPKEMPIKKYPEIKFEDGVFDSNKSINTYTQAGYTVTVSTSAFEDAGFAPWKLFNEDDGISTNNGWHSATNPSNVSGSPFNAIDPNYVGEWVKLKLPKAIKLSHISIAPRPDYETVQAPAKYRVYGSNDDSNWVQLIDADNVVYGRSINQEHGGIGKFTTRFSNTTNYYKYMALVMKRATAIQDNFSVVLGEIQYYGSEEPDETVGDLSLDTTLKSTFNSVQSNNHVMYFDGEDPAAAPALGPKNLVNGSSISITPHNATFDATNNCWTLNGSTESNVTTGDLGFKGDVPHTVSMWVNASNLEANSLTQRLFSIGSGYDKALVKVDNSQIAANTWHNVTYAYQGTGGSKVTYIDGRKVEEEKIRDTFGQYPPFAMKDYEQGGFKVTTSIELNQSSIHDDAYKLFNHSNVNTSYWTPVAAGAYSTSDGSYVVPTTGAGWSQPNWHFLTNGVAGHWVQIKMPYKIKVDYVRLASSDLSGRQAKDATIFGSNDDGKTWYTVGSWTGNTNNNFNLVSFLMDTSEYYDTYRMVVTRSGNSDTITLTELQFFGHKECDVTRFPDPTNVMKYPQFNFTGAFAGVKYETAPTNGYHAAKCRGCIVSASSKYNGTSATDVWRAFDGNIDLTSGSGGQSWDSRINSYAGPHNGALTGRASTGTTTFNSRNGEWINIKFPHKVLLSGYQHWTRMDRDHEGPYSGYLYGSNDGFSTFQEIHRFAAITLPTESGKVKYYHAVSSSYTPSGGSAVTLIPYNEYRLQVTHTQASTYLNIALLEFYGTHDQSTAATPAIVGGPFAGKVANFRVYDQYLGEERIQEIYDAQKDAFGHKKSSMTFYKGRIGVGTTEPDGALTVLDEPHTLEKFPAHDLASNYSYVDGQGIIKVSSSYRGESDRSNGVPDHAIRTDVHGYKAFHGGRTACQWESYVEAGTKMSEEVENGAWLKIQTPQSFSLKKALITSNPSWGQVGSATHGGSMESTTSGNHFGRALAISHDGTRVIVGGYPNNSNTGSVLVYDWNGSTWQQVGQTLTGDSAGDHFGIGVAISGDGNIIAVGAAFEDISSKTDCGSVRVYFLSGGSWSLLPDSGNSHTGDATSNHQNIFIGQTAGGELGFAGGIKLSYDGRTILMSERLYDSGGVTNRGRIRAYTYANGAWSTKGDEILGSYAEESFGRAVDMSEDGNHIIIGTKHEGGTGQPPRVEVHRWNGTAWVQKGQSLGREVGWGDGFAPAVTISNDGNTIAIGILFADIAEGGTGTNSGAVDVYHWNASTSLWGPTGSAAYPAESETSAAAIQARLTTGHKLTKVLDKIDNTRFGDSVSLSGDGKRLIVSESHSDYEQTNSGRLYTYEYTGTDWILRELRHPSNELGDKIGADGRSNAYLGMGVHHSGQGLAISRDGSTIAGGEHGYYTNGVAWSGAVRVFSMPSNIKSIWGSNDDVNWTKITTAPTREEATSNVAGFQFGYNDEIDLTNIDNTKYYKYHAIIADNFTQIKEVKLFGIRKKESSTLHDGTLSLTKNLTVPRIGPAFDADDTPRRERLVVEYITSTNPMEDLYVKDTSGNRYHAKTTGAIYNPFDRSFECSANDGSQWVDTLIPNGSRFNTQFSISLWVNMGQFDRTSLYGYICAIGDRNQTVDGSSSGNEFGLVYNHAGLTEGAFFLSIEGQTDVFTREWTSHDNHMGQWYHLTATYDGRTVYLYENGENAGFANRTTPILPDRNCIVRLFGDAVNENATHQGVQARISNFKLYDCCLTRDEVRTLYGMGRCDEGHNVVSFEKTRVGIGLGDGAAPKAALDVRGSARIGPSGFGLVEASGDRLLQFHSGQAVSGEPTLEVTHYGGTRASPTPTVLQISNQLGGGSDWNTTEPYALLAFANADGSGSGVGGPAASVGAVCDTGSGGSDSRLAFFTNSGVDHIERACIDHDGVVQIKQSSKPSGASESHGLRFTNRLDASRWQLYLSQNNHFRFAYNGGLYGWVDQNDSNAQMNFTGQHRTFIKDVPFSQAGDLEGLIVSANQNKYIKMSGGIEAGSNAISMNESLPIVSLSNVLADKKCFGVISDSEDPENRTEQYGVFGSNFKKEKGDTRVYINSVGEGAIWVVNTNGSLESGDYITTSNVAGYGQKQDSEFLANYTVAKITMDCDFNPTTQPIQVIRKDDNGDNVLDEHGQIQWEDHPTDTEKVYKIRYLDANGNTTDEASAVHIAAFVGCTYHCG